MACTIDESALPILPGCPGAGELIVVGNAVGGLDANGNYTTGYGRRPWSAIAACAVAAIKFFFNDFVIGQGGSPMNPGDTVLTLTFSSLEITSIINDSVNISLDGSVLPRNDNTQISYTISYNSTNVIITFNQAVQNTQQYILSYAYTN
jgi:hypothetical protein